MSNDHEPSDEELAELVRLLLDRKSRLVGQLPERPTEWSPLCILNPRTGMYFTGPGAWEFIAELVEEGHAVKVEPMRTPPGGKGYVLEVPGLKTDAVEYPPIYIKVEMAQGRAYGRSFHHTTLQEKPT